MSGTEQIIFDHTKETEPSNQLVKTAPTKPMDIIAAVVQNGNGQGLNVEVIQQLVGLTEIVEAREAKKAFNVAFAAFKAECPIIPKDRIGGGVTKKGSDFKFPYSSPEQILKTVQPILEKNGLSHRWKSKIAHQGTFLVTRCVIKHEFGHEEYSDVSLPITDKDAVKYLALQGRGRRASLINALGLVSANEYTQFDDAELEVLSDEQLIVIKQKLTDSGANEEAFLTFVGADTIETIPRSVYKRALAALNQKIAEKK